MANLSLTPRISTLTLVIASMLPGQNTAGQAPQMTAEMAFVGQRYCAEGPIRFLELSVMIRLVNAHNGNLYVLKREGRVRPRIIRVYAAKNESDLKLGRNELSIVVDSIDADARAVRKYSLNDFEKLPAEGFYEYREDFTVPLAQTGEASPSQGIQPGRHVAAVVLAPWLEPSSQARQVESELRMDGIIWTETARTSEISFTVAPTPLEEDCYKAFRESRGLK